MDVEGGKLVKIIREFRTKFAPSNDYIGRGEWLNSKGHFLPIPEKDAEHKWRPTGERTDFHRIKGGGHNKYRKKEV